MRISAARSGNSGSRNGSGIDAASGHVGTIYWQMYQNRRVCVQRKSLATLSLCELNGRHPVHPRDTPPRSGARFAVRRPPAHTGIALAMEAPMPTTTKPPSIVVKRYAGSRLYDATNRRYVTLAQLRTWAAEGIAFA